MTVPEIPTPADARFDSALEAWVLSRYADVAAALREPRLTANGARGGAVFDRAGHLQFRSEAMAAAAEMLERASPQMEGLARGMAGALPADRSVDLVSELAKPWAVEVAERMVCGGGDRARREALAEEIFEAAAEPGDAELALRGAQATVELAGKFVGPLAAFHLQAYVALTQTLPCFLANAWLALLRDPGSAEMLRLEPGLMPQAVEELLRHSGPSRAQFRRAEEDVELGGVRIGKGARVVLMLAAANRDPEQFTDPLSLDLRRSTSGHLAFGAGRHACIGAAIVRAASAAATAGFIEHFAGARVKGPAEWRGGFAIGGPAALRVERCQAAGSR